MCFESKKKKVEEQANRANEGQGQQVQAGTTASPSPVIRTAQLADLVKQQTRAGKIAWKNARTSGEFGERTYKATVGGFELTATADMVSFRDLNTLGGKITKLNVGGILNTIERYAIDPVDQFQEVLAAL